MNAHNALLHVLGVIPARGGSKGIPGKNLKHLGSMSLVARACAGAKESTELAHVVISTDSQDIADEAHNAGVDMFGLRPAAIAADDTPMLDVLRHELAQAKASGKSIDAVMVLQPTSPFRTAEHIDAAVALMRKTGADTVVSVVPVPHRFVPSSLMELRDGALTFCSPGTPLRRQDKQELFARNGPVILLTTSAVLESGRLYGDHIVPLVMDERASLDIDTLEDLQLAERLLGS